MVSKFIQIVLLASVKYFLTIPYTILIGMDYKTAVIAIVTGGIGGFLFFYYLLKPLMRITNVIKPLICRIVPEYLKKDILFSVPDGFHPRSEFISVAVAD
jgi:hypothetical protein